MNCPRCNAPNPDGQRFCGSCGAPLPPLQQDPNYGYRKPEPNPNSNHRYNYNYQQPNQNSYNQKYTQPQEHPYYKTWFLVLMSVVFPVIGIILLWIGKRPKKIAVRILLSVFLVFYTFVKFTGCIAITPDSSTTNVKTESEKNNVKNDNKVVEQAPNQEEKKEEQNLIDADVNDCHVKYISASIEDNYVDESCLVIYYEFTNNSNENKCFDYTIGAKAFQDGVELKESNFHVNDSTKDSSVEIQPGTTVTVASAYILRNDTSEISLEVSTWLSDKPKASMTIPVPVQ